MVVSYFGPTYTYLQTISRILRIPSLFVAEIPVCGMISSCFIPSIRIFFAYISMHTPPFPVVKQKNDRFHAAKDMDDALSIGRFVEILPLGPVLGWLGFDRPEPTTKAWEPA